MKPVDYALFFDGELKVEGTRPETTDLGFISEKVPYPNLDEGSMPTDILRELESLRTLEQVMHWASARKPQARLLSVVTQDEFTHDVVLEASPDVFLVFDTT